MIELLCTIAGMLAGVTAVASLMTPRAARERFESPKKDSDNREQMQSVARQLQVISNRVAGNLDEHTNTVADLGGQITETSSDAPEQIIMSINEIIEANQEIQNQLAEAQSQILEQSEMIENASKQARTDALTGLANRRALDEYLTDCLKNSNGRVVGLLLTDIDHFKNFNDTYGHTTGDAVLASFARAITQVCGEDCYPARYGGEEFAVVIAGASTEEIVSISAKIRHYASEQVISYDDLELNVTASGGLCIVKPGDDLNSAYERSDRGLYRSKEMGRNRGYWIENGEMLPFPVPGKESTEVEPVEKKEDATDSRSAAKKSRQPEESEAVVEKKEPSPREPEQAASPDSSTSEVLDLQTFLGKLEGYIDQLKRADLPGTGIMVEALGFDDPASEEVMQGWETTVSLVQANLRGIDAVCLFRQHTLCIFFPGCSQDAALERTSRIQQTLYNELPDWESGAAPTRFSLAVAQVTQHDTSAEFLNRLETALDEAVDTGVSEVVVHDGEQTHFQMI